MTDPRVVKMNEMLADPDNHALPIWERGVNIIDFDSTEFYPFVVLAEMPEGHYRVVQATSYINRANKLQITIYLKDMDSLDEAEELWLQAVTGNCPTLFGDEFRLSIGSGLRHITSHETQNVIRIKVEEA